MSGYDVVVVGAGPSGALAAREVARGGASVLLLDRAEFPRGKVCGACLSAGAVEVLCDVGLGAIPSSLGARPLRTLELSSGGRHARVPLEGGCAISRTAFDYALVRAACREGVEFRPASRATIGEVDGAERVVHVRRAEHDEEVRAAVVLDATGLGGRLGSSDGHAPAIEADSRMGLGATLPPSDHAIRPGELHMVVGLHGYVGLVRLESGALNAAAAVDPAVLRSVRPGELVAEILTSAGIAPPDGLERTQWRGTPLLSRAAHDVAGERLFRVGDAAGYVEPFTGEGMCWALAGGRTVAKLALAGVETWHPSLSDEWRAYHRVTMRRARMLCRVLAAALRRTWAVRGAMVALGVSPGLAAPFVRRAGRAPTLRPAHAP